MTIDSLNRYTGNHKPYDHIGNIIPDIEHSEGERPAHEFQPASWLPVQFWDKHYENWVVIMPGKAVALDPDGKVMPAEYGLTSASVAYTANDVTAGTIDISTGEAVTAAKTVVLAALTGVRGSGWAKATAGTVDNSTHRSGFMGRFGIAFGDADVKYPIGVAPYAYLQWAGDASNPVNYKYHNYNMQHQVAVLCDYVIKLPLVPAQDATDSVEKTLTASALVIGTVHTHTRAYAVANATGRYNATTGTYPVLATYPVIAFALDDINVAKITTRTPITLASDNAADDVSSILVNERSSLSAITQAGDFWVDYDVGVIFIYSSDGATIPVAISGAAGTITVTYYRYGTAPATTSKFACVLAGGIVPGDFLKVGAGSNLVKATPATDNFCSIIGQVIALDDGHPKDALDMVRTAYTQINTDASGAMSAGTAATSSVGLGQLDQMPGSANGGYPDLIHYAGASDTLAIINLISR